MGGDGLWFVVVFMTTATPPFPSVSKQGDFDASRAGLRVEMLSRFTPNGGALNTAMRPANSRGGATDGIPHYQRAVTHT
jgi:hypothetical protein